MLKLVRSRSLYAALVCLLTASAATAQSSNPALDRFLERVDIGLSAPVEFTHNTAGRNITQSVSSASGYLFALRYTQSPLIGGEFNYKYSRFTQNYTYPKAPIGGGTAVQTPFGVEANATEITFGYLVHTPTTYFGGFKPYAAVGLGTTRFKPTPAGGQGVLTQYRATYYWNLGTDYTIRGSHFGARAQIRELFYLAPDFGENYLTSGAHTTTLEPSIGFFARF